MVVEAMNGCDHDRALWMDLLAMEAIDGRDYGLGHEWI